jgi:ABC-2 type transport system permease protein
MKAFAIALKDIVHSFRSAFLLVMMFVAPMLLTGLLYFAFGSLGSGLALPVTRLQVVNLDQPDPASGLNAGQVLADGLRSPSLAGLLQVSAAPDEASARAVVDAGEADVAVLIPDDLTRGTVDPQHSAVVRLYYQQGMAMQASIARVVVSDLIDALAGTKIAIQAASGTLPGDHEAAVNVVRQKYIAWVQATASGPGTLLAQRAPAGGEDLNQKNGVIGSVMAGMMIFFAFFTGMAGAQAIIQEQEAGALARLLATPTRAAAILGGKFAGMVLTIALQVAVLLALSALAFGIRWGTLPGMALLTLGLAVAAAAFGLAVMGLVRTSRQAGPITGVVTSLSGVLGGLIPTGNPAEPGLFEGVSRVFPHGWAMQGWKLAQAGAGVGELLLPTVVLLGFGAVLFAAGLLGFRRRLG